MWILLSFFADPDPAVFLNADPDLPAFSVRIRIQLKKLRCDFLNLLKVNPITTEKNS